MDQLRTADAVIDKLGGTNALAAKIGQRKQVVSNWRKRKNIPAEYFLLVSTELVKIGCSADPAVFRQVREAAE